MIADPTPSAAPIYQWASGLAAIALAGFVGLLWRRIEALHKGQTEQSEALAVIKTVLIGPNGSNGLKSDVAAVQATVREHDKKIGAARGRHDLLEQRVDRLEEDRRPGPNGAYDRRDLRTRASEG